MAALRAWAEADGRTLSRQIEFLLLRALYRRGLDPTDFYRGPITRPAGGPLTLSWDDYLELTDRRAARTPPGCPPDLPSGYSPTAEPDPSPADN